MVTESIPEDRPHRGTTVHGLWPNATLENFYERPATGDARLGAWCYADRLSYAPGERLRIHVCTAAATRYDLRIYRDGWRETEVYVERDRPGRFYPTPSDCSVRGCDWPVALDIAVPSDWSSGGYVIYIRGFGDDGAPVDHHFPIAIRSGGGDREGRILLVTATATWVAYNDWGGSNFYEGIVGEAGNGASPIVSTQRPFSRGFAWLPEGAPRIPLRTPPKLGAVPAYPHMDWAYANGFSKKYASAGWATYDRHFLRWAESKGLSVDVATQHDLHADATLLDGYATVAFVGHDEYWSAPMRDAVDAYVDGGGHVARFGGNFTWQIRIEDEGRRQVCYKAEAETSDPVRATEQRRLLTTAWDDVAVGRPGTLTFGLTGSSGIYAGWGVCVPRGSGGFTVYRPDHWVFAGTDLYYGDQFGAEAKIFGYEVDGCDYTFRDGLPYATGSDGAPDTLEILAMGLATTEEADHGNPGSVFFMGDADARAIAHQRFRRTDAAALDKVRRGSGMIACFTRGKGSVFNAASVLCVILKGSLFDKVLSWLTLSIISLPEFVLGYALIFVFSVSLGLIPNLSNVHAGMSRAARLQALALPTATLVLIVSAHMIRMTKVSILHVLGSPFIEMARLKGLSPLRVVGVHALANAVAPIVTVVVLNMAYLVVGVVIVEVVFVYPGMGQLMVDSVAKRDIPVVQACALIFGATYIVMNIIADVVILVSNPRIRYPR